LVDLIVGSFVKTVLLLPKELQMGMAEVILFCQFIPDEEETHFFVRNDHGTDDSVYIKLLNEVQLSDGQTVNATSLITGELVFVDPDESVIPIALNFCKSE